MHYCGTRHPVIGLLCIGCASTSVRYDNPSSVLGFHAALSTVFLQLPFQDPLLCLTASITVWEKPVLMSPARSVLAAVVAAAGGFTISPPSELLKIFNDTNKRDKSYHSLDEVNLLVGLSLGTPFLLLAYNPFIAYSADLGTYLHQRICHDVLACCSIHASEIVLSHTFRRLCFPHAHAHCFCPLHLARYPRP